MNTENSAVRELSAAEIENVSGGLFFLGLGVFLAATAVGYGITKLSECIAEWILD